MHVRPGAAEPLNLKQVAARLGVHYMTAYRYVRQGRLVAERIGTEWRVSPEAVAEYERSREIVCSRPGGRTRVDWTARMTVALTAHDEPTAWNLIERALAAGHDPTFCYLDMIAAALAAVEAGDAGGRSDPADRALATVTAQRLVSRLGGRFRRPGRSRGSVVLGAPTGERHHLPVAIVADLVRLEGYDVFELGADAPPEAFADAAGRANRLVAVGIGITTIDHLDSARATVGAVRTAVPDVPIMVGGQAVLNPDIADLLDADAWAPDGRSAVRVIAELSAPRRAAPARPVPAPRPSTLP